MKIKQIFKEIVFRIRGDYTTEKLVEMGLSVGNNFCRMVGTIIDPSHCWLIEIGNDVTLAPRVHILAHDASTVHYLGVAKIGKVIIGDRVFIGAETVILPNVRIGNDVIVGANSTVSRDLESGFVYAGNPARKIGTIQDFVTKNEEQMKKRPCYGEEYTNRQKVDVEKKEQMKRELTGGWGYVK